MQVKGDKMFLNGVKTYVISKGKKARVGLEKLTNKKGLLKFFKTHVDIVINN